MSSIFEWQAEYQGILESIASTDVVETEWSKLRNMIKHKIHQNVETFLTESKPSPLPAAFPPLTLSNGGLKLPPFGPKQQTGLLFDMPVSYLSRQEAQTLKQYIFSELDKFEQAPFTIQRLTELCLEPNAHHNSVGKYLRAVEKSLLVTSSKDSFRPSMTTENDVGPAALLRIPPIATLVPSTPLFSPIPFLHEDARRSKSRSPPPSPLALSATTVGEPGPIETLEPKALGLVDELDDPSPGHMSDHPTALSATTTLQEGETKRPFMESLQDRFQVADDEAMEVDPPKEAS